MSKEVEAPTGPPAAKTSIAHLRVALGVNLGTTVWTGVISIVSVPLYVQYLAMEAYGVVGLFGTLQASLAILDLGLSSTMTRELARLRASPSSADAQGHLIRTLECVYGSVAMAVGLLLLGLAGPLARSWVNPEHIDRATLETAFMHMALAIAAQWPGSLYNGALLGFERQVTVSTVNGFFSTTKAIGVVAVLAFLEPTIEAFLVWQTLNSAAQVVVLAWLVWRELPGSFARARFRVDQLRQVWRFAAGNMAINASGLVLSQIDRIVLSNFLTLEAFGLYSLVSTVAANLGRLVGPVFTLYYPRLAAVIATGDRAELKRVYHDGAQVLAALVVPICTMLAIFPIEVLFVWTGDRQIAATGAGLMSLLVLGRLLNAAMHLPAALQLASGWTSLSFYSNIAAMVVVVPLVFVGARFMWPTGAALAWLLINVGTMALQVPLMHRRLLAGEMLPWLTNGLLLPLLAACSVAGGAHFVLDGSATRWSVFAQLAVASVLCFVACLLAIPNPRRWLVHRLGRTA